MKRYLLTLVAALLITPAYGDQSLRGTGDLGIIIERASGSVQIIETSGNTSLARVEGLGDLSHASTVYSRDERYAYVFGRDGGLTKIDLLEQRIVKRVMQSGNSIGGAISQDGTLVAVSNYTPGGVKIFDANTLDLVADIPAVYALMITTKAASAPMSSAWWMLPASASSSACGIPVKPGSPTCPSRRNP